MEMLVSASPIVSAAAHCLADGAPDLTGLTGVHEPWDMGILCANFAMCRLPQMNSCHCLLVGAFVESVF